MHMIAASFSSFDLHDPEVLLNIISGICWTSVYVVAIHMGFKYKRCALPIFAVCMNTSWEGIYSLGIYLKSPEGTFSTGHLVCDAFWTAGDLVILVTYLMYNRPFFPARLPQSLFLPSFAAILVIAFVSLYATASPFFQPLIGLAEDCPAYVPDPSLILVSSAVTALGIGLIMSVICIPFYLGRESMDPGELYWAKWLTKFRFVGTLVVTITFVAGISSFEQNPMLPFLTATGIFTAVADISCLVVLYKYVPVIKPIPVGK